MIKYSLELGIVPDEWKISTIIPIPKVKNSKDVKDMRPINTLPIYKQSLEEIIKSQLENYVEINKILCDEQSGIRKKFSCETALQNSFISWRHALDKGKYIGVVYIYISLELLKLLIEKYQSVNSKNKV